MNVIFAIARNTFREAIRNKVLYSLLFFAVALILMAVALGQLSVHEEVRMIRDVGLLGIDFFGVIIAIFLGVNLLFKELSLKTVYTILPKPMHRYQFLIGKWLGMVATLALISVIMGLVLTAVLAFQDPKTGSGGILWGNLWTALGLLFLNVWVVTSVSVFFSSFSTPFVSGLLAFGVFVLGRSVEEIRALGEKVGPGAGRLLLEGLGYVLPNLNTFVPSGAELDGTHVSVHAKFVGVSYLMNAGVYATLYAAAAVALAIAIFRRRDFV